MYVPTAAPPRLDLTGRRVGLGTNTLYASEGDMCLISLLREDPSLGLVWSHSSSSYGPLVQLPP